MDPALIREMQKKVAAQLEAKEVEVLDYWLSELKQVANRTHQSLPSLTNALKVLIQRMETNLKTKKQPRY